eukprot:scaffold132923_cov37-Tisochrysis_lutea.AAC.1
MVEEVAKTRGEDGVLEEQEECTERAHDSEDVVAGRDGPCITDVWKGNPTEPPARALCQDLNGDERNEEEGSADEGQ